MIDFLNPLLDVKSERNKRKARLRWKNIYIYIKNLKTLPDGSRLVEESISNS